MLKFFIAIAILYVFELDTIWILGLLLAVTVDVFLSAYEDKTITRIADMIFGSVNELHGRVRNLQDSELRAQEKVDNLLNSLEELHTKIEDLENSVEAMED